MKAQFNKVKKLVKKLQHERSLLDNMIDKKYGFNFSETHDDKIIDTLDYGIDDISFEEFKLRMEQYKKDFDKDIEFRVIP